MPIVLLPMTAFAMYFSYNMLYILFDYGWQNKVVGGLVSKRRERERIVAHFVSLLQNTKARYSIVSLAAVDVDESTEIVCKVLVDWQSLFDCEFFFLVSGVIETNI